MATKHNKHDIDHVYSLNTEFTSNKKIKRFDTRLDTLWDTLQELAWSYETIQISQSRVTTLFRRIEAYIKAKEKVFMKELNDELEKTTASINNIIDEIANINAYMDRNKPKDHNGDDVGVELASMDKLVQSIQSSKSMDQFIDKEFIAFDDVKWGDDQLMDFVRKGSQATQTVHSVTRPIRDEFDSFAIEKGIMKLFSDHAFYDDDTTRMDHGFRNHIFSLSKDSCSMLALDTGEWTVIDDKCTPREDISTSVVYARGNIYVFGGEGSPNTYSRFSLTEQKWHNDLEIIGVDGGTGISACYDGETHIYLIGGLHNGRLLSRIDCFNIDTHQFSSVGRMPVATKGSYSFFLYNWDQLFIIGGYDDHIRKSLYKNILLFETSTKICENYKQIVQRNEHIQACFDGTDHVFIFSQGPTLLVNVKDNEKPTMEVDVSPGNSHWPYKWISLQDNDPVKSRKSFGTCHIYH
ncbi:hypothetical protein SAMD00019534_015550 [Acytostelium subglobosum LB1]|uniref:hypothetical protein n=1 Tax=Acytostelium subglobosum LB1 TaxID=1410327 RepID=UPI000645028A|nr:hypothetical protein SAMD00019534_015550 [Acytostelium subglobosum LB1]GAM18380.1 hypothetical protein SAMD00019534_015550 [Acytostelium subglobosum LB1]|eukprot:XP_012757600.1 hypothetical protein SAMD00019534_015550 [Acytostelium subglobosum LB1]